MKKWRRFFQSLFVRHIIAPEPVTTPSISETITTDLEKIRFSIWQTLRAAKQQGQILIAYSTDYAIIMDELRMQGWKVALQVVPDGSLGFLISAEKTGRT
jgi:hypothetical protein